MSDWIEIDAADLALRRGKLLAPKRGHLRLSPYDVPKAVRANLENNVLTIEFRYINIKETSSPYWGRDDGVSFEVGDRTQRIYKILLDLNKLGDSTDNISIKIKPVESAIDEFISHQESLDQRTARYLATRSVFRENASSLLSGLGVFRFAAP